MTALTASGSLGNGLLRSLNIQGTGPGAVELREGHAGGELRATVRLPAGRTAIFENLNLRFHPTCYAVVSGGVTHVIGLGQ